MKQFKSFGLVVVTLLFSVTMAFAAKPNIHILATGGTIAGRQRNRRTDCQNRFAGHERPGLVDACQENQ